MTMIGLEINDAGILAAAGQLGNLLELDGRSQESPGFAVPQKGGLLVGRAAEQKAHLLPRQILNRFWDQLNTEPLLQPGVNNPQNHAEIVYHHLSHIWQTIQSFGDEIVVAVPNFYDRQQLGLILGIARELSMPVCGFVPCALAAASVACPGKMLLHLDIHLHRIEVSYLKQEAHLTLQDTVTSAENGLIILHKKWVDAIAHEFVRTTRFDPFHQAASEQELYDRLPEVLAHLRHHPSMVFEMSGGLTPYSITLTKNHLTRQAESVYGEIRRLIESLQNSHAKSKAPLTIQATHRITRLPGCKEMLAEIENARINELDPGAAARGVLRIWNQLAERRPREGISFFTSRPWQIPQPTHSTVHPPKARINTRPTHLLYRSIAYPITEKPLYVGCELAGQNPGVQIRNDTTGVSRKHCAVQLRDQQAVLTDYSPDGTFVDGNRVHESTVLALGQIIRLGSHGEQLQLIACLDSDET